MSKYTVLMYKYITIHFIAEAGYCQEKVLQLVYKYLL